MTLQKREIAAFTSSKKMGWKTPAALYALLTARRFDVSDTHNNTFDALVDTWPTTRKWFSNPPYGRAIPAWLYRAYHSGPGVMLLPVRADTKWFHAYIWNHLTGEPRANVSFLHFIPGRLKFDDQSQAPLFASMLVYFNGDMPTKQELEYFKK